MFSCGSNDSYQLGLSHLPIPDKSLVPRAISNKPWKGQEVLGISAGRFHSVVYTSSAVFTCGLNAGQLGKLSLIPDIVGIIFVSFIVLLQL